MTVTKTGLTLAMLLVIGCGGGGDTQCNDCGDAGAPSGHDASMASPSDAATACCDDQGTAPQPDLAGPKYTPPGGLIDFQARCAAPGVLRCIGFDQASDIAGAYGENSGIMAGKDHAPELDTGTAASGNSSLRFTVSSTTADSGGSYFTNFSDDLLTQIDGGGEFYVQWRQRFSQQYVSMNLDTYGNGGWKQVIIGSGDRPGCTKSMSITIDNGGYCSSSCTALETNVQDTNFRGFPQMYNSCSGSSSTQNGTSPGGTPPYNPFEEPFGTYDFKLQNAMPAPYCLYSQGATKSYFPPSGNCFGYFADEWMTFKVHIKVGARTADYFKDSHVDLWVAREGQPAVHVFDWGPYDLAAGDPMQHLTFGKVWLLSYDTNKGTPGIAVPIAQTWYDELIVSSQDIADAK
jgi:hypothetical protein